MHVWCADFDWRWWPEFRYSFKKPLAITATRSKGNGASYWEDFWWPSAPLAGAEDDIQMGPCEFVCHLSLLISLAEWVPIGGSLPSILVSLMHIASHLPCMHYLPWGGCRYDFDHKPKILAVNGNTNATTITELAYGADFTVSWGADSLSTSGNSEKSIGVSMVLISGYVRSWWPDFRRQEAVRSCQSRFWLLWGLLSRKSQILATCIFWRTSLLYITWHIFILPNNMAPYAGGQPDGQLPSIS